MCVTPIHILYLLSLEGFTSTITLGVILDVISSCEKGKITPADVP